MKILRYIIHSPITGIVVGVIIATLFYFLSRSVPSPAYAVSGVEVLARITDKAPNLRLLWNDTKINNLQKVRLVFWNSGSRYIDKSSLSKTDPLTVILPKNVKVIYHGIEHSSRPTLSFTTTESRHGITIEIQGDDALEKKGVKSAVGFWRKFCN